MSPRKPVRFAKTVPRNVKRRAGRTPVSATPLAIRTQGLRLDDDLREHAEKRMSRRLVKLARRIERITLRLEDVNGPRGGIDTRCTVKVVLSGMDSVVYQAVAPDALEAIDRASRGVERAVKRAIGRRAAPLGGRHGSGARATRGKGRASTRAARSKTSRKPRAARARASASG